MTHQKKAEVSFGRMPARHLLKQGYMLVTYKNTTLSNYVFSIFTSILLGIAAGLNISFPFSSLITFFVLAAIFNRLQQCETHWQQYLHVFSSMFGFLVGSTYWIVLAIYDPNNTSISTAWMVGCFVYAVHASIYACTFIVTNMLSSTVFSILLSSPEKNTTSLVTLSSTAVSFPLSLGIAEVIRSCGFWAMPWGMIGYTQVDNPLLSGLYPIAGIYGATVAVAGLSVSFVYWGRLTLRFWHNNKLRSWRVFLKLNARKLGILSVVMGTLFAIQLIEWTTVANAHIRARVVHTHMPNMEKYDLSVQNAALEKLAKLAGLKDADFTVYPELYMVQPGYAIDKQYREAIVGSIRQSNNVQIFGTPSHKVDRNGRVTGKYNALLAIDNNGKTNQYAKEVLLPFSEYMPNHPVLSWAMPYILNFPLSNFSSGISENLNNFTVKNIALATSLCSESVYPFQIHAKVVGRQMLINSASDSWIPNQMYELHSWQIVKARALEAQKPLLRSNNTGYSGYIDAFGNEHKIEYGSDTSEIFDVAPRYGETPFTSVAALFSKF